MASELIKRPTENIIDKNIFDIFRFDNLTIENHQQRLECTLENHATLIQANHQLVSFNMSINYSAHDDLQWLFIKPQQQEFLKIQALLARLNHAIDTANIGVWEYKIQTKTPFFFR